MKTPLKPHDELAVAAALVSRAAPNAWLEFTKKFEAFTADRKDTCVQAQADRILVTQGRAQQCVELSTLFTNAEKLANDLAAKQK